MLDLTHIPTNPTNTFTLYATGNWQTWSKPRNAKMIEIFCLGAGGGGGGGGSATGNSSGGAGGGSAGIVRGLVPAFLLPDTLYILVGKGGIGASTTGGIGGAGGISYISTQPSIIEQVLICKSSTVTASGGSSTTGGAAATISTVALSAFGNLGLFTAVAGVAGSNGGLNTGGAGVSQTALATNLTTGGAGGGGKTATIFGAAGNILAAPAVLTTPVNGGVTTGQDGDSGYGRMQPFCGAGGAGGAGRSTGSGGRGGNGWYGCGGGGAGGGSVPTVSKSGDGGDGLVIITVIT